ncbi:E3 ubiquitin-protein ligase MARCH1 [Trichinella sp. T6]|nr:E3 ubiquitin-protein ligase MARCH1 [Trichinella sp. T6]
MQCLMNSIFIDKKFHSFVTTITLATFITNEKQQQQQHILINLVQFQVASTFFSWKYIKLLKLHVSVLPILRFGKSLVMFVECSSVMPTNEENQIKAENVGEDLSCCDCSSAFLLNMPLPSENSQLLAVEQPLFVGGISQLGESKESIATSSNGSQSLCRICHLPAARGNPLITPCRCSGSLRHVHKTCLLHWLEISSTKVSPSPQCELCGYTYKTHHCFSVFLAVFRTAQCPHCTRRDCTLHLVFIAMLMLMSSCAFISVLYLSQDDGLRTRNILNRQDITVISCSLLFFVAFFVAIFTQYRSETSLFCLFARCWLINRHWRIKNYNPNSEIKKDDVNI